MKSLKLLFAICSFVLSSSNAQIPIVVESYSFSLTENGYNGLSVNVPEVIYGNVKGDWIKVLERGTKSKVTEARDGEISIFGANIKSISNDPINVFSQIMSGDSVIQLAVAIELRRDHFISEEGDKAVFNQFKDFLFSFAKDSYTEKVKVDLKEEEKKLNEIERELDKLQNEKKRLRRDIEKYEQEITDSRDALKILDSELNLKNDEMANLEVTLDSETNDVVKEDLQEKLREAKKDKRKILNSIDKEKKNISDNKSNIENAETEIEANETLQETYPEKINAQQEVVDFHQNKLQTIVNY